MVAHADLRVIYCWKAKVLPWQGCVQENQHIQWRSPKRKNPQQRWRGLCDDSSNCWHFQKPSPALHSNASESRFIRRIDNQPSTHTLGMTSPVLYGWIKNEQPVPMSDRWFWFFSALSKCYDGTKWSPDLKLKREYKYLKILNWVLFINLFITKNLLHFEWIISEIQECVCLQVCLLQKMPQLPQKKKRNTVCMLLYRRVYRVLKYWQQCRDRDVRTTIRE